MLEIENFIEELVQDTLEKETTCTEFPWFYIPNIVETNFLSSNDVYCYNQGINPQQFVHNIVVDSRPSSHYFNLVQPILQRLTEVMQSSIEVERAKFNFLPKAILEGHHIPHIDLELSEDTSNYRSMIYYVNDADGDTYFFDDTAPRKKDSVNIVKQVSPKKGKAIIFDARQFHCGSSPIENDKRIVLNIVFRCMWTPQRRPNGA